MENALLIYMMATKDARQRNEANKAINMGKQHTDCPTRFHGNQGKIDALQS